MHRTCTISKNLCKHRYLWPCRSMKKRLNRWLPSWLRSSADTLGCYLCTQPALRVRCKGRASSHLTNWIIKARRRGQIMDCTTSILTFHPRLGLIQQQHSLIRKNTNNYITTQCIMKLQLPLSKCIRQRHQTVQRKKMLMQITLVFKNSFKWMRESSLAMNN